MVYSQTAQVTKMFVILQLGLILKLVNDMLNIANICSSARRAVFPFDQVPVPSVTYIDDTKIQVTLKCDFTLPPCCNVSFEIQWFVNGNASKPAAQCDDPLTSECSRLNHSEYQLGSHVISFPLICIYLFELEKSFTSLSFFFIMHNCFSSLLKCFESQNRPI